MANESPAVIIFDEDGVTAATVSGNRLSTTANVGETGGLALEVTQQTLATEATLGSIETTATSIDGKDFATETTLSSLNTTVEAIKDTDGIKRIEDPLPSGNNIIGQAKITDGSLVASVAEDGAVNRLQTSTIFTERAVDVKQVGFRKAGISADTYYVIIDLDNQGGAGPYKHTWTSGQWVSVIAAHGILVKEKPSDEWDGRIGVVLRIDGTDADIGWFAMGTLHARDTGSFVSTSVSQSFNTPLSLEVSGGDLTEIVLGWIETTSAINTGITLKDVRDNDVTPAVGDLVAKAELASGSGTADLHYGIGYLVT